MFTGDRSGDFLYRALHAAGFASQPTSTASNDGLKLQDVYITAAAHCAPPDNRPEPAEFARCQPFLERELDILPNLKVVVALGALALGAFLETQKSRGIIKSKAKYRFFHGAEYEVPTGKLTVLSSYHPSQQNTLTGRLTDAMLSGIFGRAGELAGISSGVR
jgi:uracil-DNA glycosylase family 4